MTLTEAAQYGDALSGIGTVAAVLVALYGLASWRKQQRDQRRAEASARLLVAVMRMSRAIQLQVHSCRVVVFMRRVSTGVPDMAEMQKTVRADHASRERAREELGEATLLAIPHVTDADRWARELLLIADGLSNEAEIVCAPRLRNEGELDFWDGTFVRRAEVAQAIEQKAVEDLGKAARLEAGWWAKLVSDGRAEFLQDLPPKPSGDGPRESP